MGTPDAYQPHKLFVAVLYASGVTFEELREVLEGCFGAVDSILEPHPFTHSTYYDQEMGPCLQRALLSFSRIVDPSSMARLKRTTNALERRFARPAPSGETGLRRTVNLDPGLLSLSRVMLATTKASAHRVPLCAGYYAEVTLMFRRGRYVPFEWTYPDYRSEPFLDWLLLVRRSYHSQLRALDPARPWRL